MLSATPARRLNGVRAPSAVPYGDSLFPDAESCVTFSCDTCLHVYLNSDVFPFIILAFLKNTARHFVECSSNWIGLMD